MDNKQLITLRDYKDAGIFNAMPNGFDVLDKNGNDITEKYQEYLDCKVLQIAPTPLEDFDMVVAFYLDV